MSREVIDSNKLRCLYKLRRVADESILGDLHPLVVPIQQIERFNDQFQFDAFAKMKTPGQSNVGSGVIGADQRVARYARKTIIGVVAVLIRIAGDCRAYRPPAADCDHA